MTEIRIIPNSPRPGTFQVELDGANVAGAITAATLELRGGEVPVLTLEIVGVDVPGVEAGKGRVFIGADSVELLTRAGWTPPAAGDDGVGGVFYPVAGPALEAAGA
jgi:hypothetical protein